jgi:hypothetical protein
MSAMGFIVNLPKAEGTVKLWGGVVVAIAVE